MIIAPKFDGDDDLTAMDMQHDCYGQALGILIVQCNRLTRFARILLSDEAFPNWGKIERCDHRTLQEAHDQLAAAWRFLARDGQASLPFDGSDPWPPPCQEDWLAWLTNEVLSWIEAPELVRAVQVILHNQNTDPGYEAEEDLTFRLFTRFRDIPWTIRPTKR